MMLQRLLLIRCLEGSDIHGFSYSDWYFTVVGNLCFVHILLDGTKDTFEIPPAIVDRMLYDNVVSVYPFLKRNTDSGGSTKNIGFANIFNGKIYCSDVGRGYLSFCFPIDSNK